MVGVSSKKKSQGPNLATPVQTTSTGGPPWILIGGLITVATAGALMLFSSNENTSQTQTEISSSAAAISDGNEASEGSDTQSRPSPLPAPDNPTPIPPANAEMPPLPLAANMVPRAPEVIREAYIFAAQRPDVLDYVPCFCGCETAGHTRNADCFVQARNPDGSVREWDTHGMACTICIDVARDAMQLRASGASLNDIRSAVDAKYAAYPRQTPTPAPPAPAN